MLRRVVPLIAAVVLLLALLASTPAAVMAASAQAQASTVSLEGQATIVQGRDSSQLRMKMASAGDPAWLLEAALNPVRYEPGSGASGTTLDVSGTFMLGLSGQPLSTGTATGRLNSQGAGDLQLSGSGGSSLDVSFSVADDGSISAGAQGAWPALPQPQPAATADPGAPAQPATHTFWYLSRTAAIASYVLLFFSICLGLGLKSRFFDRVLGKWQAYDLHQFTAMLGVAFLGLHIFSLLGDGYFKFGFRDLLVPGAAQYRPAWMATGIVAFYGIAALATTALLRRHIGRRAWRALHSLSFVLFLAILLHSTKSGTDTTALWARWLYAVTGSVVTFLFLWRLLVQRQGSATTAAAGAR